MSSVGELPRRSSALRRVAAVSEARLRRTDTPAMALMASDGCPWLKSVSALVCCSSTRAVCAAWFESTDGSHCTVTFTGWLVAVAPYAASTGETITKQAHEFKMFGDCTFSQALCDGSSQNALFDI